jgi:predicted permease
VSHWIRDRYRVLRSLANGNRVEEDVREELAHHIEMRTRDNLAAGMSESEARADALRRFGDVDRVRRETIGVDAYLERRRGFTEHIDGVVRELQLAARRLFRRPLFTLFATVTLALGLGAVSAMYTVLDRIVLEPLPYADADALVWVQSRVPYVGENPSWGVSQAGYFAFRDQSESFEALGAFSSGSANIASNTGPARVRTAAVTASMMAVLRAVPALGRLIDETDDMPGQPDLVVLGYGFWQRQFGGDSSVVGSSIELDGSAASVIGVMQEGIHLPDRTVDVWRALGLDPAARPVNYHWLEVIGRLDRAVTVERAQSELAAITSRFTELFPTAYSETFMRESGFATEVIPLKQHILGDVASTLWIVFGSVGILLLIAAVNVTNLYLVRTESDRRERTVRAALGAGRRHLAWHYLTETLLISGVAGGLALGLAYTGARYLATLAPPGLPRLTELGLAGATVWFTVALSAAIGVILGAIPLLHRMVSYDALREGGRGLTASPGRQNVRRALVAGQMALALLLLAAAGLLIRSFNNLRTTDPGFDGENVLTFELFVPWADYWGYDEVSAFYRAFIERAEALPAVIAAGASTRVPMLDLGGCAAIFTEDNRPTPGYQPPCVPTPQATPDFFEALGIQVEGTVPTWTEHEAGEAGVIVTRALGRRLWPGEDPLGKGIRGNGWGQPFYRAVGVADDYRSDGLDRPPLEGVFFPMRPMEGAQLWMPPNAMRIVIKTAVRPESLIPSVRAMLADLDPTIPMADIQSMETAIERSPAVSRLSFTLLSLGVAGGMAMLLSAVGLYGVISQAVTLRCGEIGVRMALGARAGQVLRMILGQFLRLMVVAVIIGLGGALALTRLLQALLFEVSPTDPITLTGAAAVLIAVAVLASFAPALRATQVDPMEALRAE